MRHRSGLNRQQFGLFATPLDEMIAPDNMVRVVDAFVDAIDLEKVGFVHVRAHKRGAPPYHPALLLKIYIYGYLNRVRSSRRLELECGRNIELMWLTACQKPSYLCLTESAYRIRHVRHIEPSLDEGATEANRLRVLNSRPKYKRRQSIVEHPYGTVKRSWGFYYTLLKGKEKVSGEYSLVFLAYNMRRAMSILGVSDLIKWVKRLFFRFSAPWRAVTDVGTEPAPKFLAVAWRIVAVEGTAQSHRA